MESPLLYSRSLLVTDFVYSAVYKSIPISQFIPSVNSYCYGSPRKWTPVRPAPADSYHTQACKPLCGWGGDDSCKPWVREAAQVLGGPAGRPVRATWLIVFRHKACGPLSVLLLQACHLAGDAGCQAARRRGLFCVIPSKPREKTYR